MVRLHCILLALATLLLSLLPQSAVIAAQCTLVKASTQAASLKPQTPPTPTRIRVSFRRGDHDDKVMTARTADIVSRTLRQTHMLTPAGSGLDAALDISIDDLQHDAVTPFKRDDEYLVSLVFHSQKQSPRSGSYTQRIRTYADDAKTPQQATTANCDEAYADMLRQTLLGFLASVQTVADVGSPVTFMPAPPTSSDEE